MANYNLTTQEISSSFQQLMQHDGDTNQVYDGTGSLITNLDVTSSQALTASYAENVVDPTWDNIQGKPSGLVSGSSQVSYPELSNIPDGIVSSSEQVSDITGSSVVNASAVDATTTFTKGDGTTFDTTVDNVVNSLYSQNTITTGKNLEGTEILKGTPLYFTGSGTSGNLVGVYRADAGNPSRMPAGGIAGETIASGEEGIVLLDGYIGGVDTSLFQSGDLVYVGVGGGYTNQKPTGSTNQIQYLGNVEKSAINGSGVINMMGEAHSVPNIQEGYAWVGDSNGVPQAVSTASWDEQTDITQLNQFTQSQEIYNTGINSYTASNDVRVGNIETYVTESSQRLDFLEDFTGSQQALNTTFATTGSNTFTGDQTFTNIFVNGTGSFAYIESVTGSAKIIGDAFIVLNNNTPAERYAGISVQDSGSAGVTASFQFDGLNNDWFYEYSDDGGVTTDHGVVLFGPEYATKGTPTYPSNNTIQKGNGGHHLLDSNITDDGSTITLDSNTTVTGVLSATTFAGVISGSDQVLGGTGIVSSSAQIDSLGFLKVDGDGVISGSEQIDVTQTNNIQTIATTGSNSFVGRQDINNIGGDALQLFGNINQLAGGITTSGTVTLNGGLSLFSNTIISGSTQTETQPVTITSTTASIDFSETSMFELTLANGADTHITATNVGKGQTINVLITQAQFVEGTVSFDTEFLQPNGSEYTPTTTLGGQDILTLVTFNDTTKIYVAAVNELT